MAAFLEGSIIWHTIRSPEPGAETVRIGHPSGVMTMCPELKTEDGKLQLPSVAVQRTARRIMDGTVYVRE